eukprot:SAG31_NODE_692_length_12772_cov_15.543044_10_plen_198_part_00
MVLVLLQNSYCIKPSTFKAQIVALQGTAKEQKKKTFISTSATLLLRRNDYIAFLCPAIILFSCAQRWTRETNINDTWVLTKPLHSCPSAINTVLKSPVDEGPDRSGFTETSKLGAKYAISFSSTPPIHGDTFSISALHLAIKVPYFSNSGHKNEKVTTLTDHFRSDRPYRICGLQREHFFARGQTRLCELSTLHLRS